MQDIISLVMEDRVSEKSQAEREIIGCFREITRELQHNLHLKEGRTQLSMELALCLSKNSAILMSEL